MNWSQLFTSSIGKKIVMSVTGLFLVSFLVVHVGVNSCVFKDAFMSNDNGDMFNRAANFMGKTVVIRLMEYVLFAGIIIHAFQGLVLEFENRAKRKQGYEVKMGNRGSKWYSRSMGLLGTLLYYFFFYIGGIFGSPQDLLTRDWRHQYYLATVLLDMICFI